MRAKASNKVLSAVESYAFGNGVRFLYPFKKPELDVQAFFGTLCENRTHNCPLGGGCYIHLTKRAYHIVVYPYFMRLSMGECVFPH